MAYFNNSKLMEIFDFESVEDINLIKKAYALNDKYGSSDVINETALLLFINFHADINTIVASLIYKNAHHYSDKQLKELFNEDIMYKVHLLREFKDDFDVTDYNRKVMINCLLDDVKVVIIKLVERVSLLHNLNMDNISKYRNFLMDTLLFYVPISQLLGIYKIKNNLEDLCFRYDDNYETTSLIVQKVLEKYNDIIPYVYQKLNDSDISFRDDIIFKSNRKSNYDIHTKVTKAREKIAILNNDNDLKRTGFCSIKCLTKTKQECYSMLYILHQFKHLAGSFCDYISGFQGDEYRAIHTNVFINSHLVDFRICTREMDLINYYGITSNWANDKNLQKRLINNYAFYNDLQQLIGRTDDIVLAFQDEIINQYLDVNKCMSIQKMKKI